MDLKSSVSPSTQLITSTAFSRVRSRPTFPVQGPPKYELVINLKSAKALRLDVPPDAARPHRRGDRIAVFLLRCVCPLLAQSGQIDTSAVCLLSGVKRTLPSKARILNPKKI